MSKRSRASRSRHIERTAGSDPDAPVKAGRQTVPAGRVRGRGERRPRSGGVVKGGLLRALTLPAILGAAMVAVAVIALTAPGAPAGETTASAPRPILGASTAVVEIHEYGDYQCASCGAFSRNVRPQIVAAYIDTGKAKLVWHDFAWIGAESRAAANAARCAGDQGRYWEYHDLLYANQRGENQGAFSTANLKAFGAQLQLDPATFHACVDGGTYGAAVQADFADVRQNGFTGTPTFVVGGQRIVGAQPFAVFEAAIEAILGASATVP